MNWQQRIIKALQLRKQQHRLRQRILLTPNGAGWIQHNGHRYCNFSSNDYLGLSDDVRVIRAWKYGAMRYGIGAVASGHITGYLKPHAALEEELADWLGYSCALLFNSGYAANQAVISALLTANDYILADKMSHASVLEAANLSAATLRRFIHNKPKSLQRLLAFYIKKKAKGEILVVTEGIFSMDGDKAPLAALYQLTQTARSWLMVDDAHGIGVYGSKGRGSCWQQNVKPELLIITFSKAFGFSGAALMCNQQIADYMLQFARHLIYSTAMSPAQAEALRTTLKVVQQGNDLRAKLMENITHFRKGALQLGLIQTFSDTAIQPLIIGDDAQALSFASYLRQRGFWVMAIRPPTVPIGTARLRITLTARHTTEDIDKLLEALYDKKGK